jgi:iron complex transport system permease protein
MIGYLANAIIGVLKFLAPEEDVKSFVVGDWARFRESLAMRWCCLLC